MAKKLKRYNTSDGRTFDVEEDAKAHAEELGKEGRSTYVWQLAKYRPEVEDDFPPAFEDDDYTEEDLVAASIRTINPADEYDDSLVEDDDYTT